MALAGLDEEEVVQLLAIYVRDDGYTPGGMYGAEAVSAVESMRDLIKARLNTDEQNLSLWQQFEDEPDTTGAELVGWLEAFGEADPGFATMLNGFYEEFHEAGRRASVITPPITQRVIEGEGMPGLFQHLYDAVDEHPALSESNKDVIAADLREMEAQVARGNKANEEVLIRRIREIRRIAPDIVDIMLPGMEDFAEEVRGPLRRAVQKIEAAERAEEREL